MARFTFFDGMIYHWIFLCVCENEKYKFLDPCYHFLWNFSSVVYHTMVWYTIPYTMVWYIIEIIFIKNGKNVQKTHIFHFHKNISDGISYHQKMRILDFKSWIFTVYLFFMFIIVGFSYGLHRTISVRLEHHNKFYNRLYSLCVHSPLSRWPSWGYHIQYADQLLQ